MAEGKILFEDLFDSKLIQQIATLRADIAAIQKDLSNLKTTLPKTGNNAGDTEKLNAAQKERIRLQEKLIATETEEYRANQKLKEQLREKAAQISAEGSAYKQLNLDLQRNIKAYKDLAAANKAGTAEGKKLLETITAQDKKIKAIDQSIGQHQRNVGNYSSALGRLRGVLMNTFGALGITASIASFFKIFKDGISTMISFELAMAKVKSISRASGDEFRALTNDAKRLGKETQFTSSEVSALQLEFAKVGFSTSEILNATEATVKLAIATGDTLARSAEVAGATLRGFGLDTKETKRVIDVMGLSFASSALNLERFAEAMKYVAPPAAALKIPIEQVTAQLSKLADAGIHGSMAGTSLRMIYLKMAQTGLSANEAFEKLANGGMTLADANDEVGQRAQTALLILAKQRTEVDKLTESYNKATGTIDQMADVIQNTTSGSLKGLSSAWEALILSIGQSDGAFKKSIDWLTNLVRMLASANKGFAELGMEITGRAKTEAIKLANDQVKAMTESLLKNGLSENEAQTRAYELYFSMTSETLRQLEEKKKYIDENIAKWQNEGFTSNVEEAKKEIPGLLIQIESVKAEMAAMNTERDKMLAERVKKEAEAEAEIIAEKNRKLEEEKLLEKDRINLHNERADEINRKLKEEADHAREASKIIKDFIKDVEKEYENLSESIGKSMELRTKAGDDWIKNENANNEEFKQNAEEQKQIMLGVTTEIGTAFGELLADQNATYEDFLKAFLLTTINALEMYLAAMIAKATLKEVGEKGYMGLATGALLAGIMKGIFAYAKAKISQFEDGEVDIKGRRHSQGGIMAEIEGGESVINRRGTANARKTLELINSGKVSDNMLIPVLAMQAAGRLGGQSLTVNNTEVVNEIKKTNDLLGKFKFYSKDGSKVMDIHGNLVRYV